MEFVGRSWFFHGGPVGSPVSSSSIFPFTVAVAQGLLLALFAFASLG